MEETSGYGKEKVRIRRKALKNRKRDQDVILIDKKNYDNVLVLSLRFLVGNHVAKAAATCADFVLNHDYVEDKWPVPEFTVSDNGDDEQKENKHFGLVTTKRNSRRKPVHFYAVACRQGHSQA